MAIVEVSHIVPTPDYVPLPLPYDHSQHFQTLRHIYDDTWDLEDRQAHPKMIFHHGSGASGATPTYFDTFLAKGFQIYYCVGFNYGESSAAPRHWGYGNINSPLFVANRIRAFWDTQCFMHYLCNGNPSQVPAGEFVVCGQSRGISLATVWSAYVPLMYPQYTHVVSGNIGNGFTAAGSGNYRVGFPMRVINANSQVLPLVNHRTIVFYADHETYNFPDMSGRLRQTLIDTKVPVYIISPGVYGHSWYSERPQFVADLAWDLHFNNPIIVDGVPAVPGAVA